MRVLVIGRTGQLALALDRMAARHPGLTLKHVGRPDFDLETPGAIERAIHASAAHVVINAAAYTAVDRAESEELLAYRINAEAAGEAAGAAAAIGARFLHVSTDYVFDGGGGAPYLEDAPTAPVNAYGRSKLAGEIAVRRAHPGATIVRTSWVVSPFGQNFVKTMLRLAGEREEVGVVADQRGCPTSAFDLADALLDLAALPEGRGLTLHIANAGDASWADLAAAVMARAAEADAPHATIRSIGTASYPTPARRPADTRLDRSFAKDYFGLNLPNWRGSVNSIIDELLARSDQ